MKDSGFARALALTAQLGFSIACPLVVFIAGGAWLDGQLGWSPWLLLTGVLLGVLTAGGLLWQLTTVPIRRQKGTGKGPPYKVESQSKVGRRLGNPPPDEKQKRNGR
ncbi:MAG TPA: AtpZ/AtpI family protein [Chloroflexia bacterium]|nr:AtpZ/AtpI family protein [Chloroflexia bacterium]